MPNLLSDNSQSNRIASAKSMSGTDQKYRSLFENMLDGFAFCKMIFDEKSKPIDFEYLEINDAFEQLTGLKRQAVIGKRVTVAIPGIEKANPELFEIYGRVALSCKEEKFEIYLKPLSLWLSISVYCPTKGYFAAIFEDITGRKKAEEALRKLNRHLRAISNSNQALMHANDESKFTQEVCDIIIKDCGYALVWVGFAENDKGKTVRPTAFAGFDKEYIDALRITWDENSERGRGPTGTVIRTGKPYVCNMQSDINFKPWRAGANKRGYTASLVLPLISFEGKTFGALNVYSQESNPFTEEEVKLLSELSNDFAYGIIMLRLRKETEQTEETLRKQASLIDLSPDAIIVKKADDTITFWSQGAQNLYGWTKEEAIGQKTTLLFKTTYPDAPQKILNQLESTGYWSGEKVHKTKSGNKVVVHSRWLAKCNVKGEIEEILETNIDITERKKTDETLRRSEAHYRTLFNSIAEGFELMEAVFGEDNVVSDLRYLEVNDAYEQQSGVKASEVLGKTVKELFPNIEPMWIQVFDKVLKTGQPTRLEDYHSQTDRYYSVYYFPFTENLVGALFRDITESKKVEAKLAEYAKNLEGLVEERTKALKNAERLAAIGATAGMVGHDIRNPLQAITSDVYLLKSELASMPDGEEKNLVEESLEGIEKNVDYINKIVADLQDFARPLNPNAQETDIKLIIDELIFKNDLPKNIKANVNVESAARKILTDRDYLNRIMYNLVTNAVQAMPLGGELNINAYKESNNIILILKDTGIGIPEAAKAKLFTPMFTTKSKGQGFGLAVVKRMTEALGGTVTFESQEGKGTTFIVRLPSLKELNGKWSFK